MNQPFNLLLNLLFPKKCVGCNKIGSFLCQMCLGRIQQKELICAFCKRLSVGGITHFGCRRKFGLDGLWTLGAYTHPLREVIHKFKYKGVIELADALSDITLEYWAVNGSFLLEQIKKSRGKNWVIIPVPLHKNRKNWRGFNQAELVGKKIAEKIEIYYLDALKKSKSTKPQVFLKMLQRKTNIKNTFSLSTNEDLGNLNCILVDDVWTTGSTLKECCYVLKKAGVRSVWGLTLAR